MYKKFNYILLSAFLLLLITPFQADAQKRNKKKKAEETEEKTYPLDKLGTSGLRFREVGPALTSGRIADFAMHPQRPYEYYIATASGGVWKTNNAGTTYTPIFDAQGSYSIGDVTLAPSNPNVVWVGTGENNNQRSVAYGDGVYKSNDGGATWQHMGLKTSEHIGKILIHPTDENTVYVAAMGPLWNKGGERGVYKTVDGGKTWNLVLEIDEHTGVSDIVMDPRNPDILYAATHQRARHVFTYLGGGPGSAIYKTTDGGQNWEKRNAGLPNVDLGRIGLAISPANPDKLYAIVEAAQGKSGFFRSTDGAASWHKQSGKVTSGNYYQEIIADPIDENTVYCMDTWMSVTRDGGKTFNGVGEMFKHVDNHCIWVDPTNNSHWVAGCDGGIYETWDAAATWDYKANLPITQFYKVAVDNDKPFYNIYGGTQDNNSIGGPARTTKSSGINNSDWFITHGGDGFESQVDPNNPDIVYSQSQYGVLVRYDRKSGEEVGIQPKERKNENAYRWNWDAPLQVSNHVNNRLYFAANKVFRSDDRGNSWEVISDDLTRQLNRNELEIMDRVWSMEAVAKNRSTSPYGTIVALSESPLNKNLIAIGTDDGLIQITENGGESWRKIDDIAGVPARTYVNAVYMSHHDENVIYAAFNHHKYGDFKPYLFKSSDKGNTWTNISNNLPERGSVYSIEEDHIDKNLLFCGTEFGVFFTPNGGQRWKQLRAGVPTIAVRDIAIQRRENDLVLGTFGRGFYVLDDYAALRNMTDEAMEQEAALFAVRDAWMYEESSPLGLPKKAFQGDSYYMGENLGPVAMFTYYIKDVEQSLKKQRRKQEAADAKEGKGNPYPTYDELKAEREELPTQLIFTIKDTNGKVVRKLKRSPSKGINRITWDMRYAHKDPISLRKSSGYNPYAGKSEGTLVVPGKYTVEMAITENGKMRSLVAPIAFNVKALDNTVLPATDKQAKVDFQREVAELSRSIQGAQHLLREMNNKMSHIQEAIWLVEQPIEGLQEDVNAINKKLKDIATNLYGDNVKTKLDIDQPPSPATRIGWIEYEQKHSTAAPTQTHKNSFAIAKEEFEPILKQLQQIATQDIERLEQKLEDADAPYTPGRAIKMLNGH